MLPRSRSGPLPAVVEFNGYGGGRGLPHEHLAWPVSGYAYLFMDTRGQGSAWGVGGETADSAGTGPSAPGFMTRGIQDPHDYYYRRLFADAVRAVDAMRGFEAVDPKRVAVCGGSQGGGTALAVAGLVPDLVAAMPDVPFLCDFERAVAIAPSPPFTEIAGYLSVHRHEVDRVFDTLSYFDGVNFARRARCPAIFSVAIMDTIVPPSTVFAAFNHYGGEAVIVEYPFNNHEGGAAYQWIRQVAWLAER
jgi:cephalosporin-C deacetylase